MSADGNAFPSTTLPSVEEVETRWTDEQIRWPEDYDDYGADTTKWKKKTVGDYEDNSEEEENEQEMMNDPFKDPDLPQRFLFHFQLPPSSKMDGRSEDERGTIDIELHGYKYESDRIWQSTGLTVWKASKHLCEYLIHNRAKLLFQDSSNAMPCRVLELGAGLGLCGILVYHLLLIAETEDNRVNQNTSSTVYVTDGDTDALAQLRQNVECNTPKSRQEKNENSFPTSPVTHTKISCHQLIWGRKSSLEFLAKHCVVPEAKQNVGVPEAEQNIGQRQQPPMTKFDLIIASDIIYSKVIVQPLWETIKIMLRHPHDDVGKGDDAVFVMAFAKRKVPVEIGYVLEKAEQAGFRYQLVEEKTSHDVYVYEFRWSATKIAT